MAYQVLARKWRPRDFSTLVGQDHVVRALRHALENNRLHHAYLFTGTRGVGKTTIARIFAKCLNCETGITAEPCGRCSACVEIDGGRFVDLLEVDAATNTRVDEMRQLLETAQYAPTSGRFKVYVIDEVHMLSNSAFNAMLKTLEEPPEHLKFILATTDPQKIPVTVLSRCLQFSLKQMTRGAITDHLARLLQAEAIEFDRDALPVVARAANGSMRDALSILDQAIAHGRGRVGLEPVRDMLGTVDESYLVRLLEAVAREDAVSAVAIADEMQGRSLSFDSGLSGIASLLLQVSLYQASPEALDSQTPERERLVALAAILEPETVQLYYQIAIQSRQDLAQAPDEHAGFLMALLRMLVFAPVGESGAQFRGVSSPAGVTPEKADVSKSVNKSAGQAPQAVAPVKAPSTGTPLALGTTAGSSATGTLDWESIARSLPLSGAAKELARNAELIGAGHGEFEFIVPKSVAHLVESPYLDKFKAALESSLGHPVRVKVSVGNARGTSVAAVEAEAQVKQRSEVRRAIQSDSFVRELVDLFDGRVLD